MWDLPGPGLEPVPPALAGGFLTTVPPGKPPSFLFKKTIFFQAVLGLQQTFVCRFLHGYKFPTFLDRYQRLWLQDHMIRVCLGLWETAKLPSKSGCTILHSHQQWMRVPVAPHPCQHLLLLLLWIWAIVIGVWCYLIFVLICIFVKTWCGATFHMLICHLYIFFGGVFVKVFDLFLNWVVVFLLLNFKNSLYILDNSHLSNMSVANVFSQSVICLLNLWILFSCWTAEVFNLNAVNNNQLFISWIVSLVLYLKSHYPTQGHLGFLRYSPGVL